MQLPAHGAGGLGEHGEVVVGGVVAGQGRDGVLVGAAQAGAGAAGDGLQGVPGVAQGAGGGVDHGVDALERESPDGVAAVPEPQGWRHAREVVTFLRAHGARFRALETPVEGDWAALSSDGDGDESEGVSTSEKDDIVWVPSSQH